MEAIPVSTLISENAKKYPRSYVAAYKADCKGRPYNAGTITGIDLGHQVVLVTAKHVLEKDHLNPCDEENQIYAIIDSKLEQLNKLRTGILPLPKGGILDISVFVPETHEPIEVISEPLHISNVRVSPPQSGQYLAACGFPETKNKRNGKELKSRPYGYFGKIAPSSTTILHGYDPDFHFAIEINLKKIFQGGLKEVKATDPQGISGGPVFLVHDFSSKEAIDCMLSGIVIARSKDSKFLICVHAAVVVEIARTLFDTTSAT